MKSPVQLYLRVRLPDGTYPYLKAAYASNGRIRPLQAIKDGKVVSFPGSTYYLRYRIDGKRVWEPVGDDPSLADTKLRRKNLKFQELALDHASTSGSGSAPTHLPVTATPSIEFAKAEEAKSPLLLNDAIREYLSETKNHKSGKTYAAYRTTLHLFSPGADANDPCAEVSRRFENKPLAEITRKDLLDYKEFLEKRGNSPRTVRNRIDYLQIFLHHFGLTSLLKGKDLPKFTKKKVRAYNPVLLAKIFDAATQDESDLLHFLLCTGAREQEAQFVCWTDVDLEQKTYTVTEHLDLGYRPKDREEGSLPIADLLVDALRSRRLRYPNTRLIFPGKQGGSNGHALRIVKSLALRAGANCGDCINKTGKSCASHPVCKHIFLHKMRKTFASTLHHKGLPAQTLQRYLRHSDLATTIAYIADQPDEQVRETVNATFAGFGGGAR